MTAATFDTLAYVKKLEAAGFTRQQAEIQAEFFKDQADAQNSAIQKMLDNRDTALATRGDLREAELRLQKEIEQVRKEIEQVKYSLLKWQIGGWVAMAAIMAKGFGWLGF